MTEPMPNEDAVGVADMARALGVSRETVKRHAAAGTIPAFKTGGDTGHWRFYPSVVKAHLSAPKETQWNQSPQSRGRKRIPA